MAHVLVGKRIVEVSDVVLDAAVYGVRCFLAGKFEDKVAEKRRFVKKIMRHGDFDVLGSALRKASVPVQVGALRSILNELEAE